jgi:hypothetical protein
MRRAIAFALAGWFSMVSAESIAGSVTAQRAVIDQFLTVYFKHGTALLWGELDLLRPLVTEDFHQKVLAAQRGEDCLQEKEPGPPFIQGDFFTSMFEGAADATVVSVTDETDVALAVIQYTSAGDLTTVKHTWKDVIQLKKVDGQWKISDFFYQGEWDFAVKGKASERLDAVARMCEPQDES